MAFSRFASSNTMKGAFPPNSLLVFFKLFAHSELSIFPRHSTCLSPIQSAMIIRAMCSTASRAILYVTKSMSCMFDDANSIVQLEVIVSDANITLCIVVGR